MSPFSLRSIAWRPCSWAAFFLALIPWLFAGCSTANKGLTLPKVGGPIPVSREHVPTAEERAYWDQLTPARVIYVAETHSLNSDHEYQWAVLKGLKTRNVRFSVGWEMFNANQQPLLDDWNNKRLNTDALLDKTSFQKRWGTYSVMYEKILRWTQTEGVGSVALNAPEGLSRKLAQGTTLTPDEQSAVPTGYRDLPGGYEHFVAQMGENPHTGANMENFYRAQTLWDQTMATRIVDFLNTHPDEKIIVLVGRGHVDSGFGVPAYVAQKTDAPQLVVYPAGVPSESARPVGKVASTSRKSSDHLRRVVRS